MKTPIAVLSVFAFLAALAAGLWFAGTRLFGLVAGIDWRAEPMLLASAAVLLAALCVAGAIRGAKRREGQRPIRESRRQVYEAVAVAWQAAWRAAEDPETRGGRDLEAAEHLLALRASPEVLRDYGDLRERAGRPGAEPGQWRESLLSLLLRMRRELGVGDGRLAEREALAAWLPGSATAPQALASPGAPGRHTARPLTAPANAVLSPECR